MMDCELLAYLAGAIDSDGSICIVRKQPYRNDRTWPYYIPMVRLGQIHNGICSKLQKRFGGNINIRRENKKPHENGRFHNAKPMFIWQAYCSRAAAVASALLPYLTIKKKQAELLIRTLGVLDDSASAYIRGRKMYDERGRRKYHRLLEECRLKMGDLNGKPER